jgi:hypothetical protein
MSIFLGQSKYTLTFANVMKLGIFELGRVIVFYYNTTSRRQTVTIVKNLMTE